jgi:hypothetical protein
MEMSASGGSDGNSGGSGGNTGGENFDFTDGSFEDFAAASLQGLAMQMEAHKNIFLSASKSWGMNQETGILRFTGNEFTVDAPAQIIGSFDTAAGDWQWAWSNPDVKSDLARDSQKMREFGQKHGLERLMMAKYPATIDEAWEMTAVAARVCKSNGAYCGTAGPLRIFMTFGQLKIQKG